MARQQVCSLLLLVLVLVAAADGQGSCAKLASISGRTDWGYRPPNGTQYWKTRFREWCGGRRQSPINLNSGDDGGDGGDGGDDDPEGGGRWPPFKFTNFNTVPAAGLANNTGHSAEVSFLSEIMTVRGGALRDEYTFHQLHFHWGSDDRRGGSEHTINNRRWAAELHMVFYKTRHRSFEEAAKHQPDGVAVFAVLLQHARHDNTKLSNIVAGLSSIKCPGTHVSITPFPLQDLLPRFHSRFYRYYGSLTTPRCNEAVVWTVFKNRIPISTAQLKQFRTLEFVDGTPMQDNFRPTQPLNGRKVWGRPGNEGDGQQP